MSHGWATCKSTAFTNVNLICNVNLYRPANIRTNAECAEYVCTVYFVGSCNFRRQRIKDSSVYLLEGADRRGRRGGCVFCGSVKGPVPAHAGGQADGGPGGTAPSHSLLAALPRPHPPLHPGHEHHFLRSGLAEFLFHPSTLLYRLATTVQVPHARSALWRMVLALNWSWRGLVHAIPEQR